MDLFSTDVLNGVVANLKGSPQFLLDRFFPNIQTETSEEIHFDTEAGKRRLAPFVSPLVEGKIVASLGYTTSTFKPAYIKDKRVFDMNRPLKRVIGEALTGSMSPMDRLRALLVQDLQDQLNMLNRRLEVMAAQVMTQAKLTISGDNYPTVQLDFGRRVDFTIDTSVDWDETAAAPLDDLQDWAQLALKETGVPLMDVIITVDVWKFFRKRAEIVGRLDLARTIGAPPTMAQGAQMAEGGVFMGNVDGFNIWVYSGWYVDPADQVEKPLLPAGTVILSGPQMQGVRAYGAIRDEEAGLQALPYYVKSWTQPDPSVRFVMLQSAPIVVPYRPNAFITAKVL